MKKFKAFAFVSAVAFAMGIAASAHAAEPSAKGARAYTFEVGAAMHSELYEEFDTAGGKIMEEDARMAGFKLGLTRHFDARNDFKVGFEYVRGNSDYTGSLIGGNYGDLRIYNLSRNMFDINGTYGHRLEAFPNTTFSAGLGYRRLTDNLQEAGAIGYKRVNDLVYATLGVEYAIIGDQWTITPGARTKHLLRGEQFSDLLGGITVKQKSGNGSDLYVSFAHKSGLVLTPYLRTWSIKDSEVSPQGLYEPRNKTREIGVEAAWRF